MKNEYGMKEGDDMFDEMVDLEGFETFAIDNDKTADWAMEKIRTHRMERDRLVKLADEHIAALQAKKQEYQEDCQRKTNYLEVLLRVYFDTVTPHTTKTQASYQLTYGKLMLKKQQPEFLQEEAALVAWAKANKPDMVQVKESVAWGDLKKLTAVEGESVVLAETGEVVQGVVARAREDVFEVQL